MDDTLTSRLNKFLALHTGTSRREADELIANGRVTVNGVIAVIGARVQDTDEVRVDGSPVSTTTKYIYIALNKPVNYVCSRRKQGDSPTIYDLLPAQYHSLKPVGRLDRDSSGLLLLTNDGDFALKMTHPRHAKSKRYEVTIDHPLEPLHQQMISDFGVDLPDGKSMLTLERQTGDRMHWIVLMSEGRNRQIRRTFGALGYTVIRLHRTNLGSFAIGDLKPGNFDLVTL